jgi:arabinose-5-phosphate isomerase
MHLENFRRVIELEAASLNSTLFNIEGSNIEKIINTFLECKGKIVITGIGKSGHIGKKMAATFSSTGTESIFIHSTEAYHGDLGMINNNDYLILLSFSGETDEVLKVLNYCIINNLTTLSITGNENSTLARYSNFHIKACITEEACSLKLAPSSSTTVTLAIGDAIAISLMIANKFNQEKFAKFHPGGSLGKKLLGKAKDIMNDRIPKTTIDSNIMEVIKQISYGGMGLCLIYNNDNLEGIITDGDIRRYIEKFGELKKNDNLNKFIKKNPVKIDGNTSLNKCEELINNNRINAILVEDINTKQIIGILNKHDI